MLKFFDFYWDFIFCRKQRKAFISTLFRFVKRSNFPGCLLNAFWRTKKFSSPFSQGYFRVLSALARAAFAGKMSEWLKNVPCIHKHVMHTVCLLEHFSPSLSLFEAQFLEVQLLLPGNQVVGSNLGPRYAFCNPE